MTNKNYWGEEKEKQWKDEARKMVLKAFARAEVPLKPPFKELFTDVYHDMPSLLEQQLQQCQQHVSKHGEHYPTKQFAS